MTVYLLHTGDGQLELYTHPADTAPDDGGDGFFGRLASRVRVRWEGMVNDAERATGSETSVWARWRNALVCHLSESIEEQRTLWALRKTESATLVRPPAIDESAAADAMRALLTDAKSHHRRWLIVNGALLVASGLLALVPGPNVVAYYFAFRTFGHYFSWLGARQGLDRIAWTIVAGS